MNTEQSNEKSPPYGTSIWTTLVVCIRPGRAGKKQWTRVVASGTNGRIAFFTGLNPDCTASGNVNIRVTKQPEHGSIETTTTTNFPGFPKENIRFKCNEHKVKGTLVNYKAAEKYSGKDELDLLILYPDGLAREHHFDISVR